MEESFKNVENIISTSFNIKNLTHDKSYKMMLSRNKQNDKKSNKLAKKLSQSSSNKFLNENIEDIYINTNIRDEPSKEITLLNKKIERMKDSFEDLKPPEKLRTFEKEIEFIDKAVFDSMKDTLIPVKISFDITLADLCSISGYKIYVNQEDSVIKVIDYLHYKKNLPIKSLDKIIFRTFNQEKVKY